MLKAVVKLKRNVTILPSGGEIFFLNKHNTVHPLFVFLPRSTLKNSLVSASPACFLHFLYAVLERLYFYRIFLLLAVHISSPQSCVLWGSMGSSPSALTNIPRSANTIKTFIDLLCRQWQDFAVQKMVAAVECSNGATKSVIPLGLPGRNIKNGTFCFCTRRTDV